MTSMSGYEAGHEPTTHEVRGRYLFDDHNPDAPAAFDRWYAAEKAKWQAEALREAADAVVEAGGGIYSVGGDDWLRDRADSIAGQKP